MPGKNEHDGREEHGLDAMQSAAEWSEEKGKSPEPDDEEIARAQKTAEKYSVSVFEPLLQILGVIKERIESLFGSVKGRASGVNSSYSEKREAKEKADLDFDTVDEMSKKRQKAFKKRLIVAGVLIPLGLLLIVGVIKGIFKLQNLYEAERQNTAVAERMHKDSMQLGGADFKDTWKTTFQHNANKRYKEIDGKFEDINKSQQQTIQAITQMKDELLAASSSSQKKIANDVNVSLKKVVDDMEMFKSSIKSEIAGVEKNLNKKIVAQANSNQNMPVPAFNKTETAKGEESFLPLSWKSSSPAPAPKKEVEYVDEEVVEEFSIGTQAGSTLEFMADEDNNKSLIEFILQAGFAKGRLVTGAVAQTLEYGQKNPEPVYISMMSPIAIANDYIEEITDCLLIGTVQGDFSTSRAKIRLAKLSCSMEATDGEMYFIDQKVDGWVFGEDGQVGAKGRLITKEGEIVSKALPLGMLEGLIGALTQSPQLLVPGSVSTGANTSAVAQGALTGFSSGSTKVIEKISDYYIKLLDSLNPTVEMRAGRVVTVGFKGGEVIQVKPYKTVDVGAFEEFSRGGIDAGYIKK